MPGKLRPVTLTPRSYGACCAISPSHSSGAPGRLPAFLVLERVFDYRFSMADTDERRCRSESSQGRCQLVAGHDGYPHAYAWHSGDWVYSRGKGKTRPLYLLRWDDDGTEWPEPDTKLIHGAAYDRPPWLAYLKP
jgi:hypothetical protein